jgi:hypothetical protein
LRSAQTEPTSSRSLITLSVRYSPLISRFRMSAQSEADQRYLRFSRPYVVARDQNGMLCSNPPQRPRSFLRAQELPAIPFMKVVACRSLYSSSYAVKVLQYLKKSNSRPGDGGDKRYIGSSLLPHHDRFRIPQFSCKHLGQ